MQQNYMVGWEDEDGDFHPYALYRAREAAERGATALRDGVQVRLATATPSEQPLHCDEHGDCANSVAVEVTDQVLWPAADA